MKELNLPLLKEEPPGGKTLTMDEYAQFVYMNVKYTADRKAVEERKRETTVTAPFSL